MSLEIIARNLYILTEKGIGIFLHTFLPFDEPSCILCLLRLNSILKPIFLPQMQTQCCICKTYHFFLSLIRKISVQKVKMPYSNWNHCWIISQIQIKCLSSAGKVDHSFFGFVFDVCTQLRCFLSFFILFSFF